MEQGKPRFLSMNELNARDFVWPPQTPSPAPKLAVFGFADRLM
jgi:hypothetical protein